MGEILQKLQTFLGDIDHGGTFGTSPACDEELMERLFEFVINLEPDQLTEEQADTLYGIIEDTELEFEDINDSDEYDEDYESLDEIARKKVRISPAVRRQRARAYRKKKSVLKRKAKVYRRSARGKQMAKKAKRMNRTGKTATGRRQRTYR